jgi:hypothetical protein
VPIANRIRDDVNSSGLPMGDRIRNHDAIMGDKSITSDVMVDALRELTPAGIAVFESVGHQGEINRIP